jgi:hypothetical protein
MSIYNILSDRKFWLALSLSLLLAACGGGGGSGSKPYGDTTPPVVTAPASINVAASSASGKPATDTAIAVFLAGTSATDDVDGEVSVTNDAPAIFPAASTTIVTFSARDSAGNIGTASATVTEGVFSVDTTPPVVTPPANIIVAASSTSGTPAIDTAIAAFLVDASATDDVDGEVSVTNNTPVVFPAATTTTVTFSASDTAGNIGMATATVTVGVFGGNTSCSNSSATSSYVICHFLNRITNHRFPSVTGIEILDA